jgi:hypothetical protein
MAYKEGPKNNSVKKRIANQTRKDPKFSGGTVGDKFIPIPDGGPTVGTTPDRDIRTGDMIYEPDVMADPDRTPIGGFAFKGRDMLKILQVVPRYGGVALGSYLLK